MSVRGKIVAVFTLMVAVISVFIYAFFPRIYERQAQAALVRSTASVGAMAAVSVRSAVIFEDVSAMTEGIRGAMEAEDVRFVRVLSLRSESLAVLQRDGAALPAVAPGLLEAGFTQDGLAYRALIPVVFRDERVATIDLGVSLVALRAQVRSMRVVAGIVAASVFLLGLAATLWLSAVIAGPLRRIADTAERIASGDLGIRASVQTNDEVGQLARSFNTMVDHLQQANEDLERANDQLSEHWLKEVSDRKRMEHFYEHILATVAAQVGVFDLEGRYVYANASELTAARTNERAIGSTPVEVWGRGGLDPGLGQRRSAAIRDCIEGKPSVTIEESLVIPDGQERYFLRLFSPVLDNNGRVDKVIGYGVDITDRRRAESALKDSEAQLRKRVR